MTVPRRAATAIARAIARAIVPAIALGIALGITLGAASRASAQDSLATSGRCPYVRCALGIAPAWNGLAVVRGAGGERVATLGFFRAGALPVFAAHDSARYYAARAVRVRRIASVLTDVGALALVGGTVRAIGAGGLDRSGRVAMATGAAAFAVSVPLQFAADGHLARAVWWFNAALR